MPLSSYTSLYSFNMFSAERNESRRKVAFNERGWVRSRDWVTRKYSTNLHLSGIRKTSKFLYQKVSKDQTLVYKNTNRAIPAPPASIETTQPIPLPKQ